MTSDPGEEISEVKIFDEHATADALLLFNVVRDLVLWGITPVEARGELFSPEAGRERLRQVGASGLPADVVTWLDVLASVLHVPNVLPRAGVVTEVCQRIARWAAGGQKPETALAYAQAAAIAEPMDARAALLVGEMAAAFRRLQRADTWFQRAIAIARWVRDPESYAVGFEQAGWLALARGGSAHDAENKFRRALRAARRRGIAGAATNALVGLLQVAVDRGIVEEALARHERASRAVRRNRTGGARLSAAEVDLWMLTGDYARALESLDRVRLDVTTPAERLLVLARTAHAAAGAGDRERLSEAWPVGWALAREAGLPVRIRIRAALELQRAAAIVEDNVRAGDALRLATELSNGGADPEALPRVAGIRAVGGGWQG